MSLKSSAKTVTLRDLWGVLVRNILVILLAALLITGTFITVDLLSYTPMYQSTATLYILRQNNDNQTGSSSSVDSDFNLALKVVNDCNYILKMQDVVERVTKKLGVDARITYGEMVKRISITNPENTRILEVTVQSEDAQLSKALVNALCDEGAAAIENIMGFKQVTVSEYGRENTQPCNKTGILTYCLVGVASVLVMYIIFLIRFLLDDGIHSEEDVRRYLDLSVLGEIPDASGRRGRRYGYRRYGYGRYGGYYGHYGYGYGYGYGQQPDKKADKKAEKKAEKTSDPLSEVPGRSERKDSSDHAEKRDEGQQTLTQSRNTEMHAEQNGSHKVTPTGNRKPQKRKKK